MQDLPNLASRYRESNAEAHDHRLCGRAEIIDEQRNDKTNADEADADGKT